MKKDPINARRRPEGRGDAMTCPRCCKSNVGIHTCTPTEGWGRMEQEIERLRHDIERHIAIASEHATECERLRAELAECKMSLGAIHAMVDRVSTQVVRAECERAVPELAALAAKEKKMSRCPQCGMKDCCGGDFVAELEAAHTEIERLQRLRDENEALKDLIAGAADELGDFPPSKRWVDQFVKRAEAALAAKGE